MKRYRKLALRLGWALFVLLVLAIVGGSVYLLSFALHPAKNKGRDYAGQYAMMRERYPWIVTWLDSVSSHKALRDTFVTMANKRTGLFLADSTRLHALFVKAPRKTALTAIVVHGYTDSAVDMLQFACFYNKELGMNVFLPDLHANGKSGGKAMQMGWNDRDDVLRWAAIADKVFKDSTGHARIVIHGWSMGGATTMNVAGENTPDYIKCFVEDCGYTSAWDEFSYQLGQMFGLPDFPLLYTASALCKVGYGWSFGEASPMRQVTKCRKPMLFIHGGNDDFVPTRMVYPLYAAKPAPKMLVVFHGSAHAKSFKDHKELYGLWVKTFLRKYLLN